MVNKINICHFYADVQSEYSQPDHTSQHGGNKYSTWDLLELAKGLCHQPTTSHLTQCCRIKSLSCSNVGMYKNTKFKI